LSSVKTADEAKAIAEQHYQGPRELTSCRPPKPDRRPTSVSSNC
jgi:hypothetical protein